MKNITSQYKDLKEGKMSQANFMRNVRMTFPHLVTNVTSFNDSIKILKNKGLLNEDIMGQQMAGNLAAEKASREAFRSSAFKQGKYDYNNGVQLEENPYNENSREGQEWIDGWMSQGEKTKQMYADTDPNLEEPMFEDFRSSDKTEENVDKKILDLEEEKNSLLAEKNNLFNSDPRLKDPEITSDLIDEINKEIDGIDVKIKNLQSLKLKNPNKLGEVNKTQLRMGTKVEKEHTKSNKKARKIATDHLTKEDPKYYTKLKKAGLEETDNTSTAITQKLDQKIQQDPELLKKVKAAAEKAEKGDTTELAKLMIGLKEGVSGKEEYAKFNEVDNLNGQEVLIGIDCELQMDPELSKEEATKIAVKNLKKNPYYYTNYKLAGKEATAETMYKFKEGSDQMRPVKGEDSFTDKDNGMKSPKNIEKIKSSAAKANKETNKTIKGIEYMKLTAKTVRGVKRMDATGEKMKKVNVKESLTSLIKQIIVEEVQKTTKQPTKQEDPNLATIFNKLRMAMAALKAQDTHQELYNLIDNLLKLITDENKGALTKQEIFKTLTDLRTAVQNTTQDTKLSQTAIPKPVKESLKSLIKQIIVEEVQNGELSSKEDAVVRDILSTYWEEKATKTLEENKYSESVAKVKDYLKKGMITAGVAAVLASCSPEINYYPTTGRGTSYDKKPMTRSQRACPSKYMQDNYKRPKTVQLKRR
jgi:hypothetical protein